MKQSDRIIQAKVHLQRENPFFAYLVMNLKVIEDKTIPTMRICSNGDLFYNPKWIKTLDDNQLKAVLIHEVLHLALQHTARYRQLGEETETEIYNISCDLAINHILLQNNYSLPKGCVPYNDEFELTPKLIIKDIDKKSAEEIYNEIMSSKEMKQKMKREKEALKKLLEKLKGFDEHSFGNGKQQGKEQGKDVKTEQRKHKKKWNRILSEATTYAKQQGKLPSGMERITDLMLNEKVNWKQLLYKYITRELPYDYTYNKPSKKSQAVGIYMPSSLRESIDVVVSIDTSGSIGQEELDEFLGEIIGIGKSFNNINMKLIVCDCDIKDVYEIGNGSIDTIKSLKIHGGGGTSHIPIYDYVRENLPNTKFIINFTDGYTDFPEYESVKTIWVITKQGCEDNRLPFGEVIKLD